jgi:hypothetical protein
MTNASRHIRRRRRAIERLRALTTGAAVAGVAGTAGFGVLAAVSWSGDPGATSAIGNDHRTATNQEDDSEGFAPTPTRRPSSGGTGSSQVLPRIQSAPGGRTHATTGGSH